MRAKNWRLLSGQSWLFLCCNKLGPDNNPYLAQIITLQRGHFFFFLFCACAEIPILLCFLNINQTLPRKGPQNDSFSDFTEHRLLKRPHFVATPLLTKTWCRSTCVFFETNNIDVEQKHNWKSKKDKKKGFQWENKKGNKKDTGLMKKTLQMNLLMLFLLKQKQRRQKKEIKRENQGTKTTQKRKTRRKKERKKKRDRERETEKGGGQKRLRRNKGDTRK